MKNDITLVQESSGSFAERRLTQDKLYPFDRLRLRMSQNDELIRSMILRANPGFSLTQLACAVTMLIGRQAVTTGLYVVTHTGYCRLLNPDGTLSAVHQATGNFVPSVFTAGATSRFFGVTPCLSNGGLVSYNPASNLVRVNLVFSPIYLDYSKSGTVSFVIRGGASILEGFVPADNIDGRVDMYGSVDIEGGHMRMFKFPRSTIPRSLYLDLDSRNLSLIDGNGFTPYTDSSQRSTSAPSSTSFGTQLYFRRCNLNADALYFLFDTLGVSSGDAPTYVRISDNPYTQGSHYSFAQVSALAAAKNYVITS